MAAIKSIGAVIILAILTTTSAHAQGLKLESQVVVINTGDGESVMTLKNTDTQPILLYTSVQTVDEDPAERVLVTPPVARVEPGDSQLVRFILKKGAALKAETLARAIFEGIPPASNGNTLRLTIRQNVPLIIHPASLAENEEPWKFLSFTENTNGDISVKNTGDYVVRMASSISLLPGNGQATLARNYILPGQIVVAKRSVGSELAPRATSVKISPATLYGVLSDPYESPLAPASK
jgi:P pilus assembly chaperone PapD